MDFGSQVGGLDFPPLEYLFGNIFKTARGSFFVKMSTQNLKIAFIGNMNNNHFAMARYLRDEGYDAELLLTNDLLAHFHPSCDTYDIEYMKYTKNVQWGSVNGFLGVSKQDITKAINSYDIIIGTGLVPAFTHKVGRNLDIFIPYGDDIETLPRFRISAPHRQHHTITSAYAQRKGIAKTSVIHTSKMIFAFEKIINSLAPRSERWLTPVPIVYAPQYESESLENLSQKTHWGHIFLEIREKSELMVMSASRLNWTRRNDPNQKGTDNLIKGYKIFCDQNKTINSTLVLVEYGSDIEETKKLIHNLGLDQKVYVLPKMFRKDIMVGMMHSDILCGQFSQFSWVLNGVITEALVSGKPLLTYRKDDDYPEYSDLFPVYNARLPEEIALRLNEYLLKPSMGVEMGQAGRQWYQTEVVEKFFNTYTQYFDRICKKIS